MNECTQRLSANGTCKAKFDSFFDNLRGCAPGRDCSRCGRRVGWWNLGGPSLGPSLDLTLTTCQKTTRLISDGVHIPVPQPTPSPPTSLSHAHIPFPLHPPSPPIHFCVVIIALIRLHIREHSWWLFSNPSACFDLPISILS